MRAVPVPNTNFPYDGQIFHILSSGSYIVLMNMSPSQFPTFHTFFSISPYCQDHLLFTIFQFFQIIHFPNRKIDKLGMSYANLRTILKL